MVSKYKQKIIGGVVLATLVVVGLSYVKDYSVSAQTLGVVPRVFLTSQGGTGTSSPSGILYGDSSNPLKTVNIGSNLTFTGGTLSATGGGSGDPFAWTNTSYGVSTSTTLGFLNGFLSTASSTTHASSTITGVLTALGGIFGDVTGNVTGNASTATALAANGGNCAAGEIALGVDASGAVEGCYEPTEADITDLVHTTDTNFWVDATGSVYPKDGDYSSAPYYVATSTTATSTFAGGVQPLRINATTASSSINGLRLTNILNCTQALETDALGGIICGTDATGAAGAGDPIAWTSVSYGNATSTTLGFLQGFVSAASSTITGTLQGNDAIFSSYVDASHFVATSTTASSLPYATSTSITVTGEVDFDSLTSALILTGSGGVLAEYTGQAACTNQFFTALSALGVGTCTSIVDGDVPNDITIDLATLATTITVTDNESTAENNPVTFVAGAAQAGGSLGIESDGTFFYTPSTGSVNATTFVGALTGNASTATALETTRAINGVNFDGTAAITITAASSTLLADNSIFTGLNTFANATTTLLSANYASSTLYYGADLQACNATTGKLTWANGVFACGTDADTGGSGNVATSSAETATHVAFWTSTGATPATLGSDTGLTFIAASNNLTSGGTIKANEFYSDTTGSAVAPNYSVDGDPNTGMFLPNSDADVVGFTVGGTEAGRFHSNGFFGVGDVTPTFNLDVTGNARFTSFLDLSYLVATTTAATSTFHGDLSFMAEILPDGLTCANGEILKKTGANNWDCAADATAAGAADPFVWSTNYGVTNAATSSVIWADAGLNASSTSHLVYASTTAVTAVDFFGALTGNADTATDLAANGGNCAAGEIPLGVDTLGAVESCYEPTEADITDLVHTTARVAGAHITLNTNTFDVDDNLSSYTDDLTHASSTLLADNNTWTGLNIFSNATTTLLSASYASSTLYYGANLQTCNSTTGKLTWTAGVFGCGTDFDTGGGGAFSWTLFQDGVSTSTPLFFLGGASSTDSSATTLAIGGTATTSIDAAGLITTPGLTITPLTSAMLLTNGAGLLAEYAGSADCTAEFVRGISALGVGNCDPLVDGDVPNTITIDLATLATTLTITDNESTDEENPVVFVAGADPDGGSLGLETDGTMTYNPSSGTLTATAFVGTNAAYQPLDSELTTIAALTETNGNVMFVAGGAWTSDATPAIDCTDCTNIAGSGDPFAWTLFQDGVSTTTPLFFLGGASSTDFSATTLSIGGTATTSITAAGLITTPGLTVTPLTSALLLTNGSGVLAEYTGQAACTNQFFTALSALGVGTCTSILDADVPNDITIDLATTVTTNANLTGEVTSTGNATLIIESFLQENGASELTGETLGTACAENQILKANASGGLDCGTDADSGAASFPWTVDAGIGGVATSTTLGFFNGFVSTASSTALNLIAVEATSTTFAITSVFHFFTEVWTSLADLETYIESAVDTLANLVSIQGLTVTLADAGANAFFGWDDVASAYENLSAAEALTIIGGAANDFDGSGDVTIAAADISDQNAGTDITADLEEEVTTGSLVDGAINEPDLDADNAPGDTDYLQYDSTGTNFVWRTVANVLSDIGAEVDLVNEAGLYGVLSDVSNFLQTGDVLAGDDIADGSVDASELGADVVTHTEILDSDQADTKCIWFEDPVAADDFNSIWANKTTNDFLLTELWAESDQTVTFMLQVDDGTPADIDTVDLAPAAGEAEDVALDGDTTVAAGEELDLAIASVANTPTWVSICFTGNWID